MISAQPALNRLIDGNELFYDEMLDLMRQIMRGGTHPGADCRHPDRPAGESESVSEIAAAATVMREFATPVPVAKRERLVDTCGTGGDGAHTFNISTTSAFVAAAAGARAVSMAGARCRPARAAPTCWKPWASSSTSAPRRWANASTTLAWVLCLPQPSQRHEARRPGAPRTGRAHAVQYPRPADQPGRR